MVGIYVSLSFIFGIGSMVFGGLAATKATTDVNVAVSIAILFGLISIGTMILAAWENLSEKIAKLPKK